MQAVERAIFSGMQVLVEQQWMRDQAVIVEEGRIKAIIPEDMIKHHLPAEQHVYSHHHYLIPGLIDMHVHGARGKDVMDATEDALTVISQALAKEGVTGYLATTMTAATERIEAALVNVAQRGTYVPGAAILGVHLEGPFIAKEKMGAQAGHHTLMPDIPLMQHWQRLAQDQIKLVTLAPELPGALEMVSALRKMGVIASVGHTDATYTETCAAIEAGCTQATHLFNAMSGLHQREPGAAGALLLSNLVAAELIVDGVHLHPAMCDLALQVKGKDKVLLVTDAMRAKCMGDGQYELGGQQVTVTGHKATLSNGVLAGSTLTMSQAIKNLVVFTGCALADAIYMASYVPAKLLGLAGTKGSIAIEKDADLVVLNAALEVELTMRAGRIIAHHA